MYNPNPGIKVTQFLLLETGTYNPQYRRPYETRIDGTTMAAVQESVATSKAFSPALLGGIASRIVAPSTNVEIPVHIHQQADWNERRMRFMMEVEYDFYTGGRSRAIVLGYTSHLGVHQSGTIDPQMEFVINSITQAREINIPTVMGVQAKTSIWDNAHLLANNNYGGVFQAQQDQRMRPEDVYRTMQHTHLYGLGSMVDTRTTTNTAAVKSHRTNGSSANYMSSILRNYMTAQDQAQLGQTGADMLEQAAGFAQEQSAVKDTFLQALASVRGRPVEKVFTIRDLLAIDPMATSDHVMEIRFMNQTMKASATFTGQTAYWDNTDLETDVATILSQSVPSLMMEVGLTRVVFSSQNREVPFGQAMITAFSDARSFASGDVQQAVQAFRVRLETDVMRGISHDNQIDFWVEMQADLVGETRLRVSLGGGPFIDYVTPSFADALLVPVLTTNPERALTLAKDFENLAMQLANVREHRPEIVSAGGWTPGSL